MDGTRIKREPLREASHVHNNATTSNRVNVKGEEALNRTALRAIPAFTESPTSRTSSPRASPGQQQRQDLQTPSQQSREGLREQYPDRNSPRQARERGEQVPSPMTSQSQPAYLPGAKEEATAATPARQHGKLEPPSSQSRDISQIPTLNCLRCDKANARGQCPTCNAVYYCSADCQTRDWSRHHLYCTIDIIDPGPDRKAALVPQIAAHNAGPQASIPTPQHCCLKCQRPNVSGPCSLCNTAFYCSPDCQVTDWPRHHMYCSQELSDPGPASISVLAAMRGQHGPVVGPGFDGDGESVHYGGSSQDGGWAIGDDSDETRRIIELFASIPDIDVLPEDRKKAPNAMAVELLAHQRVGLTWLIEQEDSTRRGGILADSMGLGKTIQALSLILAQPSKDSTHKTTLIVAPLALLRQWEREIESKIKPAYKLKTIIVHGQKKKSLTVAKLLSYDIVLTTYGTIAAEYSPPRNAKTKKLIMSTRFHRIILDEAHKVKNDKSNAAKAVTSIRATYRLCMTGTPLMNNVKELYSLVRFLRISPYDGWKRFYEDFEKPLRGRNWEHSSAMQALQAFLRTILLQRTPTSKIDGKQILNLPELTTETAPTEFNEDQRHFYNHLEQKLALKFNKYLKAGTVLKNYSYILVLILRLRQCCCHPLLIMNHGIPEGARLKSEGMITLALHFDDSIAQELKAQTDSQCPLCDQVTQNPIVIHPCGHQLCGECFTGLMIIRDSDRHCDNGEEDDEELPLPNCPSPDCCEVVDPYKVLCHRFFLEAHSPQVASDVGEAEPDDLDDEDNISVDEEDADEYGNLRGFIVSDRDESLSESEDDEYITEDDVEDPVLERQDLPRTISEEDSQINFPAEDNGEVHRTTGSQSTSQTAQPNEYGTDSDDSLPELGVLWQRAGDHKPTITIPAAPLGDVPSQRRIKRNPKGSATRSKGKGALPRSKSKTFKEESDDESGNTKSKRRHVSGTKNTASATHCFKQEDIYSDDETESVGNKRKRSKGKEVARSLPDNSQEPKSNSGKKKNKYFTSLADLKVESNKNAAAKQRYIRRLRKEYESSAKIDRTMVLLQGIHQQSAGDKILIFSVFTSFLDLLEIPIQDEGYGYRRYDGAMSTGAREAAVDDFKEKPDVKIMLISMMAGNAGLNLQEAKHVIILDPFWNPSIEDQAVGRAHRLGQTKPVTVHKMLIEGTVEDRIVDLQEGKRALVGEVLNNEAARSMGRLSVNELARLFGIDISGRSRRR